MPDTTTPASGPRSSSTPATTTNGAAGPIGDAAGDDGIKHFVIDTNVLLHDPNALFVFQEHEVIIPFPVLEELDKRKRDDTDVGRNAGTRCATSIASARWAV